MFSPFVLVAEPQAPDFLWAWTKKATPRSTAFSMSSWDSRVDDGEHRRFAEVVRVRKNAGALGRTRDDVLFCEAARGKEERHQCYQHEG